MKKKSFGITDSRIREACNPLSAQRKHYARVRVLCNRWPAIRINARLRTAHAGCRTRLRTAPKGLASRHQRPCSCCLQHEQATESTQRVARTRGLLELPRRLP
jgi:hypothetical protein